MSFEGIYSIYRYDKENDKYEKMAFYDKNGKELYDILPSNDPMLNQLLLGYSRYCCYDFEDIGARRGVPTWYADILKKEHPDWFDCNDDYMYNLDEGTYYDYLELKGWEGNSYCEQIDWVEAEENIEVETDVKNPPRRNPLIPFMEKVRIYLEAYNMRYPKPGEIIIICEMSY